MPSRSAFEATRDVYVSVVTVFVSDMERAIDFYTKKLGWNKTMVVPMGEGARWVTVAPHAPAPATALEELEEQVVRPPQSFGG